jgi:hypothetical protein
MILSHTPRRNWAAFDTPRGFLIEALAKSLGKRKSRKLIEQFNACVKSYRRSTVRLRPELSKLPSAEVVEQRY